jgi:hypothetical protein
MIYDMIWYWYSMIYDWYDMIYDMIGMIWYIIWLIWYMIDMTGYMIWLIYDMIYSLTAIGLTPGGSSTVHIYTQTIHGTTQWNTIPRTEHT